MLRRLIDRRLVADALKRFPQATVLVVGDLMLDRFIWGDVERISPEAPVPVVWVRRESSMPGGAANVARNVCSLGGRAILVGVIGRDQAGRQLVKDLKREGVRTDYIVRDKGRPTTVKTRVVAHNQQVVRIDREEISELSPAIQRELIGAVKRAVDEADAVIIEDYGKGVINRALLEELIPYCHRRGRLVTVDPKKDHFPLYKGADVITPNRKELADAVGRRLSTMEDIDTAARQLMRRLSLKGLLVTLSEQGMKLYQRRGKALQIPTTALEVYDVSGAGDTVIASFSLARAIGLDMPTSAAISNLAAGVVVGKIGVAACLPEELLAHTEGVL